MKVLVAGGTGRLGTLVVRDLSARGLDVTVLTRDPRRARHLNDFAGIAVGDVRKAESLAGAVAGSDVVVSAVHGFAGPGRVSPKSVDRDGNANLIAAAAQQHAEIVLMSVVGASPDSPMELFRCKWAAEQRLRRSGTSWTIVRATAFVEMWAELMRMPIVFGQGNNPVNFVSVQDVAAAVRSAVLNPALRGRILEIGGPQNITLNELAALVQQLRHQPGKVRHVPRPILRALAAIHRLPRAALTMDITDMTFDATTIADGSPLTPLSQALRGD